LGGATKEKKPQENRKENCHNEVSQAREKPQKGAWGSGNDPGWSEGGVFLGGTVRKKEEVFFGRKMYTKRGPKGARRGYKKYPKRSGKYFISVDRRKERIGGLKKGGATSRKGLRGRRQWKGGLMVQVQKIPGTEEETRIPQKYTWRMIKKKEIGAASEKKTEEFEGVGKGRGR